MLEMRPAWNRGPRGVEAHLKAVYRPASRRGWSPKTMLESRWSLDRWLPTIGDKTHTYLIWVSACYIGASTEPKGAMARHRATLPLGVSHESSSD